MGRRRSSAKPRYDFNTCKMPSQAPAQANERSGALGAGNAPIVGIGASAGGLEAFSELLTHLPESTGLSFVFIQHLDPHYHSLLTELLQPRTAMKVQQAANGTAPQPNQVYVIPPNTSMEIQDRTLQLSSRQTGPVQMPIDLFFRSLAEDQGAVSIGIVLSGSASDGTVGLKAIKAEGGITFAQDPASAGFDGMPRSAIAGGCVDFVLTPKGIAQELVHVSRHPYVADPNMAQNSGNDEREFAEIFGILRTTSGVDFTLYKHGTIRRRIFRRMALHKIEKLAEYARFLRDRRSEAEALFQDLLINVTAFFREPATFQALHSRVFPALVSNRAADDPIRIWIPGCSTGEEVYSVAIAIMEYLEQTGTNVPVQIFGTDLSEAALERARAGAYPESISADVSPDRLQKFFAKVNGHYQISRNIRDMCIYARQNLTKDPPFSHLDLLICRNLLIYFGPALQKRVMRVFHYALKPAGFLVLGVSESVGGSGDLFTPLDRTLKIYSRKQASTGTTVDFESYEEGPHGKPATHRAPIDTPLDVQKRMDQTLLSRYTPAALVVNGDLRILHFRGQTGRYLEHTTGAANLNLQQMARAGLGVEVRNLIQEIETKKSPLASKIVSVPLDKDLESVELSVSPFDGLPGEPQYLVVFEAAKSRNPAKGSDPQKGRGKRQPAAGRVRELEDELAITRRYLQTVIEDQEAITEELKSANEEIQSSNEELQSTNEELLTAKEELQSTNEELTTVNEEMQNRNDELVRTNNDLVNLLSSVNIPIIMLGNDLKIRRFTPQTERLLSLLPSDVGRSISDFKLKINVPDLEDLVRGVLDHLTPAQREVHDPEGRAYTMWIRPYRTADNKIDGAVLALFDVTDRKQATVARYRRLFESSRDGIIIADQATGVILDVNPFATRFLGRPRADLIGVPVYGLEVFANADIRHQTVLELQDHESLRRETSFAKRDGERVEAEILANTYHEGDRLVALFNLRDVTAGRSVRPAADAERDARDLETAARMAASISRNFGNDLTTILNLCDLLLSEPSAEPVSPDIQRSRDAASRAVACDRQLLAFGRRDTGRKERVNLNEILSDMGQLISAVIGDRYAITSRVDPALLPVEASPAQIERIILNLFMNARRPMPGGGGISVETANVTIDQEFSARHPAVGPGQYVSISVTDTARPMTAEAGLNPEAFRVSPSQYSGLPAAFEAIRELGAQVWAFSELGVGSTVRVFFRPAEAVEAAEPAAAQDTRGSETILIIDPDDDVRAAAARGLKANGYNVLEARSADEARRIAQDRTKDRAGNANGKVHLIVADVNHSNQNTAEAARALAKAAGSSLAWVSSETDAVLADHGVLDHPETLLRKPYSAEQMAIFVRATLRREHE